MSEDIQKIVQQHESLDTARTEFKILWEQTSRYVNPKRARFYDQDERHKGEFLERYVYDDTAIKSNKVLASALIGYLFPNAKSSFKITAPKNLQMTGEVENFYEKVTERLTGFMDDSRARLGTSLDEYMIDQGSHGNSGIYPMDNEDLSLPIKFESVSVHNTTINEGRGGSIDEIYIEYAWTVKRVVQEYGLDSVSEKTRNAYKNGKYSNEVRVLHALIPRELYETVGGKALKNKEMAIASLHIEKNVGNKSNKLLKESGFFEMPLIFARMRKATGEMYGRGPGIDAISTVLQANATREALVLAKEMALFPPLFVLDQDVLGGGIIDLSPAAVNILKPSGTITGTNPILPLQTVGDIQGMIADLQELRQNITDHFHIDRLLNFNNETQMTAREALIRRQLQQQSLGAIFSRQIIEMFDPLIERCYAICDRKGLLGVVKDSEEERALLKMNIEPLYIPEEVLKLIDEEKNAYKIEYFTPAYKIFLSERANSTLEFVENIGLMAQLKPDVLDRLDDKVYAETLVENYLIPANILKADEQVEEIRAQRQEALQAQQQQESINIATQSAKNIGVQV